MKKCIKDNKVLIILTLILVVQVMTVIAFASKKEGYFIDEVLTFSLANREETGYYNLPVNAWTDIDWYLRNMTAQEWATFRFDIPYLNQVQDVSPPLFYMLIHAVCSFFPGQLSQWMGIGLNLFFYAGCTILIYCLGRKIFQDSKAGLLLACLFGFTYGAINSAIFIRMYMMSTFMLLAHVSVYVHYFSGDKIPKKGYCLLAVTAVLGSLTQYYFLIGAVFLGMWCTFRLLHQKRYKELFAYFAAVGVSAVSALMIFPAMLRHILKSGRGAAAIDTLTESGDYLEHLRMDFNILNSQMFSGKMLVLIIALAVMTVVIILKKKERGFPKGSSWLPLLIASVGYFMVVAKVAPYQTDRYIMPTYPLIYVLTVGAFYCLLQSFLEKKKALVVCLLVFGLISVMQLSDASFHYLYEGYNENNVAQGYQDENCVVISEDHGYWYYDIQAFTQYESFFWLRDFEDQAALENVRSRVVPAEEFVLYIRNTWTSQEIQEFFQKNFEEEWSLELQESCNSERYMIYHCKKNTV